MERDTKAKPDIYIYYNISDFRKEVIAINIIVHYPKDIEAQQELDKKAAIVHAQTVLEKIKASPYPAEQKTQLIAEIQKYILK